MADDRLLAVYRKLAETIDNTEPMLVFEGPFQLLVAVILSAQTTDGQVNRVTPELFGRYPDPGALAAAPISELEELVHTTGFYRMKAKHIKAAARTLSERFAGRVPDSMEELTAIPGVGRKSANVVLGAWFGRPAIIVDTHFSRVVRRLEFTEQEQPVRIEAEMREAVPESIQYEFSMLVNRHGRATCRARGPLCDSCVVRAHCRWPDMSSPARRAPSEAKAEIDHGDAPGAGVASS